MYIELKRKGPIHSLPRQRSISLLPMRLKSLSFRKIDRKRRSLPAWYLCMSHSIDLRELFPPTVGGAILAGIKFISKFDLKPLAHWPQFPEAVSFVVAAGGLVLATFSFKRKPVRSLVIGIIILVGCVVTYTWLSSTPPWAAWLLLYDIGAHATYWGSYFVYGFCAGRISRFIILKRA